MLARASASVSRSLPGVCILVPFASGKLWLLLCGAASAAVSHGSVAIVHCLSSAMRSATSTLFSLHRLLVCHLWHGF